MKRVKSTINNLWFDGTHYWVGPVASVKAGPFEAVELEDIYTPSSEDSTVVDSGSITARRS